MTNLIEPSSSKQWDILVCLVEDVINILNIIYLMFDAVFRHDIHRLIPCHGITGALDKVLKLFPRKLQADPKC